MSHGAPGWIAFARTIPPEAYKHTPGQPNNYREKMAAYGVHDQSALKTEVGEKQGMDSGIEKKADAEQVQVPDEGDGNDGVEKSA